ncbi:hypothetical protein [Catenulispora pinisilvae]|uniref:hypothetical protein n=1 Tax=Catenulispora pinisilvae TaxID=2705253 RepID=UPI0018926758|nr:hypothetical protein [Catenulispora pinisilvae]
MSQTDQIAGAPPNQTAAAVPGPRAGGTRVGNKTALLVIACVAQFMVVLDRSKYL